MGVGGGRVDEEVQVAKTRTPLEGRASSALPRWADRARVAAGHTSSSPPLCASRRPGLTAACIVHIFHIYHIYRWYKYCITNASVSMSTRMVRELIHSKAYRYYSV